MLELIITFGFLLVVLAAAVIWQQRQARRTSTLDERSGQ